SALMRANADSDRWHPVPRVLWDALAAASDAYHETQGRFDPRVLLALTSMGYDRTLPFGSASVTTSGMGSGPPPPPAELPWLPGLSEDRSQVRIGPVPIDLGGIGKGLTVRWAASLLEGTGTAVLVEAGGDCW